MTTSTTSNGSTNRTGIATAPKLAQELIAGASKTKPSSAGDEHAMDPMRDAYEKDGGLVGSLPGPGGAMALLLDKLGERLAFERTGTRLYEALMAKHRSEGVKDPAIAELSRIHDDEQAHFVMLKRTIDELGGDATVETPSADIAGVVTSGVPKVVTDPRTTFAQALQAILVAELADHDGWTLLVRVAEACGQSALVERFNAAKQEEETHLRLVRAWLERSVTAMSKRR